MGHLGSDLNEKCEFKGWVGDRVVGGDIYGGSEEDEKKCMRVRVCVFIYPNTRFTISPAGSGS